MAQHLSERDLRRMNRDRVKEDIAKRSDLMEKKRLELDKLLHEEQIKVGKGKGCITSTPLPAESKKKTVELSDIDEGQGDYVTVDKICGDSEDDFEKRMQREIDWMDSKMKAFGIIDDRLKDSHLQERTIVGQVKKAGTPKIQDVSDDEEERLQRNIKRMEMENERMDNEIFRRQLKMEEKVKEDRIRKLRKRERSLTESIRQKEGTLSQLENYSVENLGVEYPKLQKPSVPLLTEETYEEWKLEIDFMLRSGLYHEEILRQAVRNSLTGRTRKILLSLSPDASTRQIVDKLESVYGDVKSGEANLAEFYSAKQLRDESVAQWGIRLEGMLHSAMNKGLIRADSYNGMLRNRFWRNLHSEKLKFATRWCYDTAYDFEDLRLKVRTEENEMMAESSHG